MGAYDRWVAQQPNLAKRLPTVATPRPGRHVYFRADVNQIRKASKSGGAILTFGDGEMRGGGYCLLPPSQNGAGTYSWVVPMENEMPLIDLRQAELLPPMRHGCSLRFVIIRRWFGSSGWFLGFGGVVSRSGGGLGCR